MIIIVNRKTPKQWPAFTVKKYCGRGSPLGNEFTHLGTSQHETVKVEDRDEACDMMRIQVLKYLLDDKNMFPKSQKIKDAFNDIYQLHRHGETVALECYCLNRDDSNGIKVGQRCHTEDIKLIVEAVEQGILSGKPPKETMRQLHEEWVQLMLLDS